MFVRRYFLIGSALFLALALSMISSSGFTKNPEVIRIGVQKYGALIILKQLGTLDTVLAAKGIKIEWTEFPGGPQLPDALNVGSIDFGVTGEAPPVFAQAAGAPLLYVGAEPPAPDGEAILVPKDSPIKSVADLKGKKVALNKGSNVHNLLVNVLASENIAYTDITTVFLPPADARAAFEKGAVDAWAIWDPYYAATELAIQPRVLATGRELSNNNSFYLASVPFATRYANTIAALFDELTRADRLVQENRKEAIKLIADFSGLDAGVVSLFLQRRPKSPVGPLKPETIADQQRVADAFAQLGLIPKPVKVAEIVWQAAPQRLAQAATPAKLK